MADWFDIITSNIAFELVIGAFLATIGGYIASLVQESRRRKSVREGLGTILHAELLAETPRADPIYRDPDHATRLKIGSVSRLLEPGIIDPTKHHHLMMDLIALDSIVSEFNERAMLWDQAFAAGADHKMLQTLYNALQSSNWDYRDIHENILVQLWQLGPPMPLSDTYEKPNWRRALREKFDNWRTRKLRKAWEDYQARQQAEREELARAFAPPVAGELDNAALPDPV